MHSSTYRNAARRIRVHARWHTEQANNAATKSARAFHTERALKYYQTENDLYQHAERAIEREAWAR